MRAFQRRRNKTGLGQCPALNRFVIFTNGTTQQRMTVTNQQSFSSQNFYDENKSLKSIKLWRLAMPQMAEQRLLILLFSRLDSMRSFFKYIKNYNSVHTPYIKLINLDKNKDALLGGCEGYQMGVLQSILRDSYTQSITGIQRST